MNHYLKEYDTAARTRSAEPDWLAQTRDHAIGQFVSLGFPTTRDEEWRFTSVAPIATTTFRRVRGVLPTPLGADAAVPFGFSSPGALTAQLVFVNGWYAPDLSSRGSLPDDVRIESLATTLRDRADDVEPYLAHGAPFERHAFTALNTAFLEDGAFIRIPAHTHLEAPIHVLFLSTADGGADWTMSHPRVVVVLGEESRASLIESYAGPDGQRYLTNSVTEMTLAPHAVLDHYRLQHESVDAYHVGTTHVRASRNANVTSHSISVGGSLVRNDVVALLDGEGVECTLNGLYVANAQRHVDNHTTIDHAKPHCGSREVYKGILADRARGVFNGKIIVRADAQKTDAKQTNRALLLSEDAQINTKPQLEIFANDVRCTHGAAVGQLDDEAVFYLRSRGLGVREARHILVHAFAGDVLNRMPLDTVRARVERVLLRQLSEVLAA